MTKQSAGQKFRDAMQSALKAGAPLHIIGVGDGSEAGGDEAGAIGGRSARGERSGNEAKRVSLAAGTPSADPLWYRISTVAVL